jgi:hypothetical protein
MELWLKNVIYRISGVGGFESIFSKRVDSIKIGSTEVNHFAIEFANRDYGYDLDGIIRLDFLQQVGAVINFGNLTISTKVNM